MLKRKGQLTAADVFRVRVRHFSDGVALGSREFVNAVFREFREQFGPRRRSGARPIRALAALGLNTLRDLRVRAFG